jgi:UDP-N-acetyl-D-mannosaminuronic acid dehydrogenase
LARKVNELKPKWVIEKVKRAIFDHLQLHSGKTAKDVTLACYGLAFKPDIDDLRESPAVEIVKEISKFHAGPILAVEPNVESLPEGLKEIELCSFEKAESQADIQLLLVDHREFKERKPTAGEIFDVKGVWL